MDSTGLAGFAGPEDREPGSGEISVVTQTTDIPEHIILFYFNPWQICNITLIIHTHIDRYKYRFTQYILYIVCLCTQSTLLLSFMCDTNL